MKQSTKSMEPRRAARLFFRIGIVLVAANLFLGLEIHNGDTMEPTLQDGQLVFFKKERYSLNRGFPDQGDIVVVRPHAIPGLQEGSPIRRVAGLPGETVVISDRVVELGPDEVFVTGDNLRMASERAEDSSAQIKLGDIKGSALVILWPLSDIGAVKK